MCRRYRTICVCTICVCRCVCAAGTVCICELSVCVCAYVGVRKGEALSSAPMSASLQSGLNERVGSCAQATLVLAGTSDAELLETEIMSQYGKVAQMPRFML